MQLKLLCIALVVLLACGCDKPDAKSRGVTTTTVRENTEPAATEPASQQPLSRPTTSTLFIGEQAVDFPVARLVEQEKGPGLTLLLFSDDPPEAVHPSYKGNRYYFEIDLDVESAVQLPQRAWTYRANSMDRDDSPVGVFLNGDAEVLQPYDVSIVFSGRVPRVTLSLAGQFLKFQRRGAAPEQVWVRGAIHAVLEPPAAK